MPISLLRQRFRKLRKLLFLQDGLREQDICCIFLADQMAELHSKSQCDMKRQKAIFGDRDALRQRTSLRSIADKMQRLMVYPNLQTWSGGLRFARAGPGMVLAGDGAVFEVVWRMGGWDARRVLNVGRRGHTMDGRAVLQRADEYELLFHHADGYYLGSKRCEAAFADHPDLAGAGALALLGNNFGLGAGGITSTTSSVAGAGVPGTETTNTAAGPSSDAAAAPSDHAERERRIAAALTWRTSVPGSRAREVAEARVKNWAPRPSSFIRKLLKNPTVQSCYKGLTQEEILKVFKISFQVCSMQDQLIQKRRVDQVREAQRDQDVLVGTGVKFTRNWLRFFQKKDGRRGRSAVEGFSPEEVLSLYLERGEKQLRIQKRICDSMLYHGMAADAHVCANTFFCTVPYSFLLWCPDDEGRAAVEEVPEEGPELVPEEADSSLGQENHPQLASLVRSSLPRERESKPPSPNSFLGRLFPKLRWMEDWTHLEDDRVDAQRLFLDGVMPISLGDPAVRGGGPDGFGGEQTPGGFDGAARLAAIEEEEDDEEDLEVSGWYGGRDDHVDDVRGAAHSSQFLTQSLLKSKNQRIAKIRADYYAGGLRKAATWQEAGDARTYQPVHEDHPALSPRSAEFGHQGVGGGRVWTGSGMDPRGGTTTLPDMFDGANSFWSSAGSFPDFGGAGAVPGRATAGGPPPDASVLVGSGAVLSSRAAPSSSQTGTSGGGILFSANPSDAGSSAAAGIASGGGERPLSAGIPTSGGEPLPFADKSQPGSRPEAVGQEHATRGINPEPAGAGGAEKKQRPRGAWRHYIQMLGRGPLEGKLSGTLLHTIRVSGLDFSQCAQLNDEDPDLDRGEYLTATQRRIYLSERVWEYGLVYRGVPRAQRGSGVVLGEAAGSKSWADLEDEQQVAKAKRRAASQRTPTGTSGAAPPSEVDPIRTAWPPSSLVVPQSAPFSHGMVPPPQAEHVYGSPMPDRLRGSGGFGPSLAGVFGPPMPAGGFGPPPAAVRAVPRTSDVVGGPRTSSHPRSLPLQPPRQVPNPSFAGAAAGTEFFPPGSAVVPPGSTTFEPFRAISSLVPAEPRPVSVPGDILARRDHGSSPSSDDENHIVRRGAAPAARPVSPGGGPASASSRSGATSVGDRSSERIDPLSPKRSSEPRTPRTRRVPRIVPSGSEAGLKLPRMSSRKEKKSGRDSSAPEGGGDSRSSSEVLSPGLRPGQVLAEGAAEDEDIQSSSRDGSALSSSAGAPVLLERSGPVGAGSSTSDRGLPPGRARSTRTIPAEPTTADFDPGAPIRSLGGVEEKPTEDDGRHRSPGSDSQQLLDYPIPGYDVEHFEEDTDPSRCDWTVAQRHTYPPAGSVGIYQDVFTRNDELLAFCSKWDVFREYLAEEANSMRSQFRLFVTVETAVFGGYFGLLLWLWAVVQRRKMNYQAEVRKRRRKEQLQRRRERERKGRAGRERRSGGHQQSSLRKELRF